MRKYDHQLRNFAVNQYGDLGHDIVQDVYLKLINYDSNKLLQIEQKQYTIHLLKRMVYQRYISLKRKEKDLDCYELDLMTENTTLAFEIDRDRLTFEQSIFLQYYEQGLSMLEISKLFKLNYKTVTNNLKSIQCRKSQVH